MDFIPLDPKLVSKHERIAQEKERKARKELDRSVLEYQRNAWAANLGAIAALMRKNGASEQSIQTALKGLNEHHKWTSPVKDHLPPSKQANPEPPPALSYEAPGFLLSEVETQPIDWLWPKRIPLGKITILDGDPGMGKSLLAVSVAASVSTGRSMPGGTPGKQGGVILIAPEDSAGDTIRPRLQAAGGDPSRVLLLNTLVTLDEKKIKIYDRPISLSHDLDVLEERIKQMNAVLLILDPLTAVLGKSIDQSRDQDVREVFTPLAQLAERTGCAILIIRHLSKVGTANLLYRGAGSIGIIAVARLALIVAPHPTAANKRILATTKNNLSEQAINIAYRIEKNEAGVPYIQWLEEDHHDVNALVSNTPLSAQRQAILRVLNNSKSPLALKDIADRTGQDYDRLRKTLHRMLVAKEIASPARGEYTTIDHPCMTKPTDDNHDVPAETSETTETMETLETSETSVPD